MSAGMPGAGAQPQEPCPTAYARGFLNKRLEVRPPPRPDSERRSAVAGRRRPHGTEGGEGA
eukprot:361274-Chlamydomonas_euryale.AAC.4